MEYSTLFQTTDSFTREAHYNPSPRSDYTLCVHMLESSSFRGIQNKFLFH